MYIFGSKFIPINRFSLLLILLTTEKISSKCNESGAREVSQHKEAVSRAASILKTASNLTSQLPAVDLKIKTSSANRKKGMDLELMRNAELQEAFNEFDKARL